jgi:YD repeat-containing protein
VQGESTGPLSWYNITVDEWSDLTVDAWSNLPTDASTPVFASVYDPNGNALTITDPSGTSTFTYDATNRIETLAGPSGVTTFTYDDSGQLLKKQAPMGATTTYTWDGDGRLIKAELPGSAVFTMVYDDQGMLGSKQSASGTTMYLWHDKVLQAQTDGSGNPIKVYTQGQGGTAAGKEHGDISASYDVAGDTTSYPLNDAQGTD